MSTTGQAAILARPGEPLVVDTVEFPDPAPDQVLVKVLASGVCHSQLHQIHRAARPGAGRPQPVPTLLGHEATGVVVARGARVQHVREGDHVLTTWVDRDNAAGVLPPVGHAVNERPQPTVRWRGEAVPASAATWAEYVLASERLVVPLDRDVATDVTSVIGCAVMTGAGAVLHTLQVRSGQAVAVFGAGGIGLCALAAAAIVDAYPIVAIDLADDKLAFARRFGATHTVNASAADPVAAVLDLTAGGVDYAIEAVGLPSTVAQAVRSTRQGYPGLRRGGTALMVGLTPPGADPGLDTGLFGGGRSFTRTTGGDCRPDRDFPTFVRWYREGKLRLDELVTRRYRLDQINEAVDDLEQGRITGRSILAFS
jgi:Zn-dependent alcohol dehydrogenase